MQAEVFNLIDQKQKKYFELLEKFAILRATRPILRACAR